MGTEKRSFLTKGDGIIYRLLLSKYCCVTLDYILYLEHVEFQKPVRHLGEDIWLVFRIWWWYLGGGRLWYHMKINCGFKCLQLLNIYIRQFLNTRIMVVNNINNSLYPLRVHILFEGNRPKTNEKPTITNVVLSVSFPLSSFKMVLLSKSWYHNFLIKTSVFLKDKFSNIMTM